MEDHRTANRLVLRDERRAVLRSISPDTASDGSFEYTAIIVDLSSRGAAVRVGVNAGRHLTVGLEIMVGLKPTPTTEFRWLRTRIANSRRDGNDTVVVGLRWIPCRENEDTIGILATYVVEEGLRRAWATGRDAYAWQQSTVNFLVIANWSLGDHRFGNRLLEMAEEADPATFDLAVPVVRPPIGTIADDRQCAPEAAERLDMMLRIGRRMGLSIDGRVVGSQPDVDPAAAVVATLRPGYHHRVVVSTFAASISSWLTMGVLDDINRVCRLPVERVECGTFVTQSNAARFDAWASSHGVQLDTAWRGTSE